MAKVKPMIRWFIFGICAAFVSSCSATRTVSYSGRPVLSPEIFGEGVISRPDESVFDIAFTPDGQMAYFTRRKANAKQQIFESDFVNGQWSSPKVCSFSTDRDEAPFLSSDGKTLFFGSERPLPQQPNEGGFDMNIWQTTKTATGWSTPTPLPPTINSVQQKGEEWPSSNANFIFSLDGTDYLYTTMVRGTKTIEVYRTTRTNNTFTQPTKISGLFGEEGEGKYWKYSAVISPNGQYMMFNSTDAPGGVGGEDIYVCQKTATGWSRARGIGSAVNTKAEESSPRFSRDGKYFFFGREKRTDPAADGIWSLYYIETAALRLDKLF